MRSHSADPLHRPLLDAAELAALIALGRRLARAADDAPTDSGRHGGAASRHLGSGLDFAEHRRYLPGDDPRRMDWRVTARIGQPHIRRYHEDLVPDCLILVDRRATMRFATRGHLKVTQAVRLAVVLAAWHSARQAPVSVLELDTRVHRHGPVGSAQLAGLARRLAAPCPPIAAPGPSLTEAIARLEHDTTPGTRLILLSDFADAAQITPALWHRLSKRHPLQAIRITDPAERAVPSHGQASLCWSTPQGQRNLPLTAALQQRIQQTAAQQHTALRDTLRQCRITLRELSTRDDDLVAALQGLC